MSLTTFLLIHHQSDLNFDQFDLNLGQISLILLRPVRVSGNVGFVIFPTQFSTTGTSAIFFFGEAGFPSSFGSKIEDLSSSIFGGGGRRTPSFSIFGAEDRGTPSSIFDLRSRRSKNPPSSIFGPKTGSNIGRKKGGRIFPSDKRRPPIFHLFGTNIGKNYFFVFSAGRMNDEPFWYFLLRPHSPATSHLQLP